MKHSQWKNSHDKKQVKGGLRHQLLVNNIPEVPAAHKSEWFCDVFWGEYSKFIGLSKLEMTVKARVSTLMELNVGPLHFSVEKWRSTKV